MMKGRRIDILGGMGVVLGVGGWREKEVGEDKGVWKEEYGIVMGGRGVWVEGRGEGGG